jgi:hypothetical protein
MGNQNPLNGEVQTTNGQNKKDKQWSAHNISNKARITQETGPNTGAPERSAPVVLLLYSLCCIDHEHFDGYYSKL